MEEYEAQVDFQPVVPMPDLVEIKTGNTNTKDRLMHHNSTFLLF